MRTSMWSWRWAMGLAALALALAPAAWATDGTVLITQATASHGLPGCPVTGFPIVICQPGSYKLASNLNPPDSVDAIHVTVDEVTIDLNGFTIAGVRYRLATGILDTGNDLTVMNGTVYKFYRGIELNHNGLMLKDVKVSLCSGAGVVLFGSGMITGSRLMDNTAGVFAEGNNRPFTIVNSLIGDNFTGIDTLGGAGAAGLTGDMLFDNYQDFDGPVHSMGSNMCSSGSVC